MLDTWYFVKGFRRARKRRVHAFRVVEIRQLQSKSATRAFFYVDLHFLLFQEYKKEKEEEQRRQLSESGAYKRYRRYMKKGGPGQMSMGPEWLAHKFAHLVI